MITLFSLQVRSTTTPQLFADSCTAGILRLQNTAKVEWNTEVTWVEKPWRSYIPRRQCRCNAIWKGNLAGSGGRIAWHFIPRAWYTWSLTMSTTSSLLKEWYVPSHQIRCSLPQSHQYFCRLLLKSDCFKCMSNDLLLQVSSTVTDEGVIIFNIKLQVDWAKWWATIPITLTSFSGRLVKNVFGACWCWLTVIILQVCSGQLKVQFLTPTREHSLLYPRMSRYELTVLASFHVVLKGINAYLDSDPNLPLEFRVLGQKPEEFTVQDVFAWVCFVVLIVYLSMFGTYGVLFCVGMELYQAKMMSFDLSNNAVPESIRFKLLAEVGIDATRINELLPPYPSYGPTILTPADVQRIFSNSTSKRSGQQKQSQTQSQAVEEGERLRTRLQSEGNAHATKRDFRQVMIMIVTSVFLFVTQAHLLSNSWWFLFIRTPKSKHKWSDKERAVFKWLFGGDRFASNNWVVSGAHTTTGNNLCGYKHMLQTIYILSDIYIYLCIHEYIFNPFLTGHPFLANDPHLTFRVSTRRINTFYTRNNYLGSQCLDSYASWIQTKRWSRVQSHRRQLAWISRYGF